MAGEFTYLATIKDKFTNEEKEQIALLMQKLDEIEYQLPPISVEYFVRDIDVGPMSHQKEIWIIVKHESLIIGYLRSTWNMENDNLNVAKIRGMLVREEFYRKGIGTAIITEFMKVLPPQIDKISYWAIHDTPGQYFMETIFGEKPKQTVRVGVSEIRNFEINEVQQTATSLRAEAESNGFQILYIENAEFSEQVDLDKYMPAYESVFHDMPMEEMTTENEIITHESFLEKYQSHIDMGYTYFTYVAVKNGEIAGMTDSQINNLQPIIAEQLVTGVVRSYRGNNLGLTLKYQMLEKLLTDTQVEYWVTDNAGSNEHMIRINNALGYK
ncbi:MAG: GNAT family N-acetyltransferase [Candidatus Heimdallarchaeota archaeon]|nr:GNAT family N-acetyltransferase [Candidatus Heimdallarchaeota archaeon]